MPALLLQIIIVLAIAGIALWALGQFPIDPTISKIIRVLVIVVVAIWALYLLVGLPGGGPIFVVPRR